MRNYTHYVISYNYIFKNKKEKMIVVVTDWQVPGEIEAAKKIGSTGLKVQLYLPE